MEKLELLLCFPKFSDQIQIRFLIYVYKRSVTRHNAFETVDYFAFLKYNFVLLCLLSLNFIYNYLTFLFLLEFPKFSTFIKGNRKGKREIWLPNTMALLIGIPSSGTTWLQRYSCDIQIPLPLMCLVKTLFIVSLSVETFYTREDFWQKPIGCQNGAKDFFQT